MRARARDVDEALDARAGAHTTHRSFDYSKGPVQFVLAIEVRWYDPLSLRFSLSRSLSLNLTPLSHPSFQVHGN